MPHHIYTTPGFIVYSRPQGEAGKYFMVFTRDLGMVNTTAQGVRLPQSKLRYYTQDFSYSLFSLVRGKDVWRMTGAKETGEGGEMGKEEKKLYVRILTLLRRLLPGEDKNENLFEVIGELYTFLSCGNDKEKLELIEYLTVFRILHSLGYISSSESFKNFSLVSLINDEILKEVAVSKDKIIKQINNGLTESQL